MKAILSFFDFWTIVFSFHFCFDLSQVSNCYQSDSFIFCFPFFKKAFQFFALLRKRFFYFLPFFTERVSFLFSPFLKERVSFLF